MVEQATETVKVRLIDGTEKDVLIAKYLPFRKKQQLQAKLTEGIKMSGKTKTEDVEIPVEQASNILLDLAEAVWVDKNIKIDDVEGESLSEVLTERFERFLGGSGFTAKKQD